MLIFAIDPGNTYSAYALVDIDPIDPHKIELKRFGKVLNAEARDALIKSIEWYEDHPEVVSIERIAGMGMAVGKEVFETCEWVGRFTECAVRLGCDVHYIYRRDEKVCICGSAKAKDANIRQALIDRYAKFDFKRGTGTKKNPDVLYGVSSDVWSALAVATTFGDMWFKRGYYAEG